MESKKKVKKYPPTNIILKKHRNYYGFLTIEKGDDESFYIKPYFYNKNILESVTKTNSIKNKIKVDILNNSYSSKTKTINPYISIKKSGRIHINGFAEFKKVSVVNDFITPNFNKIDGLLPVVEIVCADFKEYKKIGVRPSPFLFNWIELSRKVDFPKQEGVKGPSYIIFDFDSYLASNENLIVSLFITPNNYEDSVNSSLVRKFKGYVHSIYISNDQAKNQLLLIFRKVCKSSPNPHTVFMIQPFDDKLRFYKISH